MTRKEITVNPAVSINLCCYNSEKYLEETLLSIVGQTYKDWELVIINDGSTDSTEKIITKYINQGYPIIYYWQENHGLGYSRNEAIKHSKGKYIAFIDHDDLWMPQKLEKQMTLFDDPEVGLVYSDAIYFNEEGNSSRLYQLSSYYEGRCFRSLLTDYFLCLQTVVIRRAALNSLTNWFDIDFNMSEDQDLFTRIGYKWKLSMVNEPLAKWRVHSLSQTWTEGRGIKFADELDEMLEKYEKIIPDFNADYAHEIFFLRKKNVFMRAMFMWRDGRNADARRILLPLLKHSMKAWFVFVTMFFPEKGIRRLLTPFRRTKISPS
jgi:glycosyltransferase involved in cell wall biosynthesis